MDGKTISRDEAIATLYQLVDNEIIDSDLSDDLQEIANNIEHEKYGIHTWGIPDDEYFKIVVVHREDLKDEIAEQKRLIEKHSFTPSKWEQENPDEVEE